MTNPDNIVRVRARNGGRASVYEANGWAQAYTSGLLEGNGVIQNTVADMNVLVGGSTAKPDVVLAENPSGYKIALDLVGQQAVAITAPATNSRISAIVAYTDDLSLQSTEDTVTGSPASCGLIVVNGTAGATPSDPTDAQIRTAITADGATGSQAAYCVIATILVASNTTTITDSLITTNVAQIGSNNIDFTTTTVTATVTREGGASFTNDVTRVHLGGHLYCYLYEHEPGFVNTSNNIHVGINIPANKATILGGSITPCISNEIHFDLIGHQSMSSDNSSIYMDIWLCRATTSSNTVKVSAVIFTVEP